MTILTIGHSTHTPEDFLRICRAAEIEVIVDIRSHPTSHWEWWRNPECALWLTQGGVRYVRYAGLGGWIKADYVEHHEAMGLRGVDLAAYSKGAFPKQRIGVDRADLAAKRPEWASRWTNQGLYDYNWYTTTAAFRFGIEDLIRGYGRDDQPRAAIMCAEAMWWKCHRSMVADVLAAKAFASYHVSPVAASKADVAADVRRVRIQLHNAADRIGRYSREARLSWEAINIYRETA